MRVIWKYPLRITDQQTIKIPFGAEILGVQAQRDQPVLYALVEPTAKSIDTEILTFSTGQYFTEENIYYRGTYLINNGSFVGHVFVK